MRVPCYIREREEEGQFVPTIGGGSGIRTHDTVANITVFKLYSVTIRAYFQSLLVLLSFV